MTNYKRKKPMNNLTIKEAAEARAVIRESIRESIRALRALRALRPATAAEEAVMVELAVSIAEMG
jgi:hypothetical protein